MKKLMLGNEAVARGLYEAGCRVVSSYPGTPSTEITEFVSKYTEIAADPLFTSSYAGIGGGLIIAVADDQGMHSSQNEQDSRHYAIAAKVPMLEPSDSAECKAFVHVAYELSEQFDTPVILRLSTRVSHSQSVVEEHKRENIPLKDYKKDPKKYVMMPGNARLRHIVMEDRMKALAKFAEDCPVNRIEWGSRKVGVITSGIAYQYAREAFGEQASYLKLGLVHPLPKELIRSFAA